MKKALATILLFIYLSATMGATLHLHYCMDRLVSWSFSDKKDKICSFCGMDKTDHEGCCKDEQKVIKLDKDQKLEDNSMQLGQSASVVIASCFIESPPIHISSFTQEYPISHGPPLFGNEIYIRNCVFRI